MVIKLDIVNECLDGLGEDPIDSLESGHPELGKILNTIERERKRLLSKGWYFNTHTRTYYPDNAGKILLPDNILSMEPEDENMGVFSNLGGTLYSNDKDTNIFSKQMELTVVVDYPELNIPFEARDYLSLICTVEMMTDDDITGPKLQKKMNDMEKAGRMLMEQHLRAKQLNMNNTPMRRQLGTRAVPYAPIYKGRKYRS